MSLLKKTLASFGIGNAQVDLLVQQDVLFAGEHAVVKVQVYGGAAAQEIDNIAVHLCCQYWREALHPNSEEATLGRIKQKQILASWALPYAFIIEPGQTREFDVSLRLPLNTPVTIGDTQVWLESSLDIAFAADPSAENGLTIRPDPLLDGILTALEAQGLRIRQVECEAADGFELPFVQEFEFVPTMGPFHGRWRELEMVAVRSLDSLQLWFAIDRHRDGIKGMLASLLGSAQLQRQMILPVTGLPARAGEQVIDHLISWSDL